MPPPPMYEVTPEEQYFNLLLYGKPGVGKTLLAATAQEHDALGDVLFLNIEGGLRTVARRGVRAIDIESLDQLEEIIEALANNDDAYASIRTVVIDSLTELQTMNLEEIVFRKHRNRPNEIYMDDYGESTVRLKRVTRWLRDLPMNVIFTALEKAVFPRGQENAEPIEVAPSLTAKLSESVMGYMDFVWYMFIDGEGNHSIMTRPWGIYRAKTRGDELEDSIINPNLGTIYDQLLAGPQEVAVA